LGGVLAQRNRK